MINNNMAKAKNYWEIFCGISREIFSIFLIGYLFFFLLDELFNGLISNFINLNYILVIVLIFGFISVLSGKDDLNKDKPKTENKLLNISLTIILGIVAAIVVFVKINEIGLILSIILAICSGLLISLISYLFLNDNLEAD